MRDLKLSEAKEICKKNIMNNMGCEECEFHIKDIKKERCNELRYCAITNWQNCEIDKEQPKDKIETLEDTINYMTSKDYKDRFKAEYCQLKIRFVKLETMVKNWEEGKLDFIPTCSKEIYEKQLNAMANYILMLEVRAKIEGIELDKGVNDGTSNN